jgi:hypothetical protein
MVCWRAINCVMSRQRASAENIFPRIAMCKFLEAARIDSDSEPKINRQTIESPHPILSWRAPGQSVLSRAGSSISYARLSSASDAKCVFRKRSQKFG